jgi:hypothetical protein
MKAGRRHPEKNQALEIASIGEEGPGQNSKHDK